MMTATERRTLKTFDALAARLAALMARKRITEATCLRTERVLYAMQELRTSASPALRKVIKHGKKS
jgi:hypothetical protein